MIFCWSHFYWLQQSQMSKSSNARTSIIWRRHSLDVLEFNIFICRCHITSQPSPSFSWNVPKWKRNGVSVSHYLYFCPVANGKESTFTAARRGEWYETRQILSRYAVKSTKQKHHRQRKERHNSNKRNFVRFLLSNLFITKF